MDELSKKSTPVVRPTYEPEGGVVEQPTGTLQSTMETEDEHERRHLSSLKPAEQVGTDVFRQEDASRPNRWITPEAKGIVIKKRTGPESFESTRQDQEQ